MQNAINEKLITDNDHAVRQNIDIAAKTTNGGKTKRTRLNQERNKTNIIVKEHFIGTKTFEEKILNIMIRKIENEQK